jgi:hypothetical protein
MPRVVFAAKEEVEVREISIEEVDYVVLGSKAIHI